MIININFDEMVDDTMENIVQSADGISTVDLDTIREELYVLVRRAAEAAVDSINPEPYYDDCGEPYL